MPHSNLPPDWNLLPTKPREFFDLSEEFDRKDLKRAYNRLIRQYKPERHPAEFQRIRAAFEELDLALRYGYSASANDGHTSTYHWSESTKVAEENASPGGAAAPRTHLTLHKRLETESPVALYRELKDSPQKDPYDYFALALISDIVGKRDPLQFAHWLLEGLRNYPSDPGLSHLMRDYLRDQPASPVLVKLLVACSQAVPSDNFYPLTEPAWEVLLRELPFAECLMALKQCQQNLRDISISGRVVFAIRVLRFALWRDTSDWKQQTLDFVEENFEHIPPHLEWEVDLLTAVHQYVATREQFLNGNPLRAQIDQALESYFTLDQVDGDQAVLQCQLKMLDDTEQLLAAFPVDINDDTDDCEAMYTLWDWLSADVAERYGAEQGGEVNTELWQSRCKALLRQCNAQKVGTIRSRKWKLLSLALGLSTAFSILIIPIILCFAICMATLHSVPPEHEFWPVTTAILTLSIFGGLVLAKWLSALVNRRFWTPRYNLAVKNSYLNTWRREVLDFLDRSQLPFSLTNALLHHVGEGQVDKLICQYYQQDYGLAMFATARRFLV